MTIDSLIETILNAPSVTLTYDDVCRAFNDPADQDTLAALCYELSEKIETATHYERARAFVSQLSIAVLNYNCRETGNQRAADATTGVFSPKDIPVMNIEGSSFF